MVDGGFIQMAAFGHPYTYLGIFSTVMAFIFAIFVQRRRNNEESGQGFIVFMIITGLWAFTNVLFLFSQSTQLQIFFMQLRTMFQLLSAVSWLIFVLIYTGKETYLTYPFLIVINAIPAFLIFALFTNPFFQFYWTDITIVVSNGISVVDDASTTLVYIEYFVMYAYSFVGMGILIKHIRLQSTKIARQQTWYVIIASIIMILAGTISILDLHPYPKLHIAGNLFVFGSFFLFWALYGHNFLDIIPIARTKVIAGMQQSIFVIDPENRIVDANPSAAQLIDSEVSEVGGMPLEEAFPNYPEFYDSHSPDEQFRFEVKVNEGGEETCYSVRQSPLENRREQFAGRVIVLEDITKQKNYESELERQNERLEQFASTLSHDLRNPLNMITGYVNLAQQNPDEDEYFEKIQTGAERMDAMIEDVLTLARDGNTVTDPEQVSITETAETAWEDLSFFDATITIEGDMEIMADKSRVRRLFENFFRNSIEHGGETVDVRVGPLVNGFFIEDNGPGIPEENRDDIFDYGVTYSEDGTGFGLAIIKSIVKAHGWNITVTEGQNGGARFEITRVASTNK